MLLWSRKVKVNKISSEWGHKNNSNMYCFHQSFDNNDQALYLSGEEFIRLFFIHIQISADVSTRVCEAWLVGVPEKKCNASKPLTNRTFAPPMSILRQIRPVYLDIPFSTKFIVKRVATNTWWSKTILWLHQPSSCWNGNFVKKKKD